MKIAERSVAHRRSMSERPPAAHVRAIFRHRRPGCLHPVCSELEKIVPELRLVTAVSTSDFGEFISRHPVCSELEKIVPELRLVTAVSTSDFGEFISRPAEVALVCEKNLF